LKSLCETLLQQWVDQENASYLLQVAEIHGASILKAFCANFILKQFDSISDTTEIGKLQSTDISLRERLKKIKPSLGGWSDDEESEE
jgi:hypothetical protein